MQSNLSRAGKTTLAIAPAAAGTGTSNGSVIDTRGFDSATAYLTIGTIDATGTVDLKWQQGDESDLSDASDLANTKVSFTAADDDNVAICEINQPTKRYIRPVCVRSTANAVLGGCVVIQTRSSSQPVTHDATVVGAEFHHAALSGEGTA